MCWVIAKILSCHRCNVPACCQMIVSGCIELLFATKVINEFVFILLIPSHAQTTRKDLHQAMQGWGRLFTLARFFFSSQCFSTSSDFVFVFPGSTKWWFYSGSHHKININQVFCLIYRQSFCWWEKGWLKEPSRKQKSKPGISERWRCLRLFL